MSEQIKQYEFDDGIDEKGKQKHAHLLDGKQLTGTSSVVNVLAKGGLTWWASGMCATEFGWLNPKKYTRKELCHTARKGRDNIAQMDIDQYLKLLHKAYYAHKTNLTKTAKKGIDLHEELEHFVKGVMGIMEKRKYDIRIEPFIRWSRENVDEFLWSEAHCYDDVLWVGGISDTGVRLKTGKLAVIDFKSSKETYLSQFIQDAGYALQIEKNGLWNKTGTKNKKIDGKFEELIVVPFGAEVVTPVTRTNVEELKQAFVSAVSLYRLVSKEKTNY